MKKQVEYQRDLTGFYRAATEHMIQAARAAIEKRGVFHMALAGGRTPAGLYQQLQTAPTREAFPWKRTHFFWSDERCVPLDHQASNAGSAIDHLPMDLISAKQLHVPPTGCLKPEAAARLYAQRIAEHFAGQAPVFDMILLGIGKDGHTASLFPGHPDDSDDGMLVRAVHAPEGDPPGWRITFTLPLINQAREAMILSADPAKLPLIREILNDAAGAQLRYPAARVHPSERLVWVIYPDV